MRRAPLLVLLLATVAGMSTARAIEFNVIQVANENLKNRTPSIGETGMAAWSVYEKTQDRIGSDIYIYHEGATRNLTLGMTEEHAGNVNPLVQGHIVVWTSQYTNSPPPETFTLHVTEVPDRDALKPGLDLDARWIVASGGDHSQDPEEQHIIHASDTNAAHIRGADGVPVGTNGAPTAPAVDIELGRSPSGNNEIVRWSATGQLERLTIDYRNDLAPGFYDDVVAWQKAKGWPFGWEIFAQHGSAQYQLTTNFYYDMAPRVHKKLVTWYGWDGHDFEVFLHDAEKGGSFQITSNQYDDVSPVIWDGVVAWEAYPAVEADIFLWRNGTIQKLSDNIEDDFNPRIWQGQVTWEGFDGDDFEIYVYNGTSTVKLTSNTFDDVNPDVADSLVTWMGYQDNWDPEIYAWEIGTENIIRLTENEYDDRAPKTAGRRIIWEAAEDEKSYIFLATPK